jgi:hypothetical protein
LAHHDQRSAPGGDEVASRQPSFKSRLEDAVAGAYEGIPDKIDMITGVPAHRLPPACPYSWEQIMQRPHDIDPDRPWPN